MAKTLEGFDFGRTHGNAVYPWADWTNGAVWEITHGVDFQVEPEVMRGQIIVRGRKNGKPTTRIVRTEGEPDKVVFQFPGRIPEQEG